MAAVTSDFLAALLTNYQARFGKSWNEAAGTDRVARLAQRIQSNTLNETVPFRGAVSSGPQDVTHGVVEIGAAVPYSLSITNKVWQDGWDIQREAFDDDRLGLYADAPQELVASHRQHMGRLVGGLFETGTTELAYDGVEFFKTSRSIGDSGTINNIVTQTGVTTTAFLTDLESAQVRIMGFLSDKGLDLELMGNVVAVPRAMYHVAWKALTTNSGVNPGSDNFAPPAGEFEVGGLRVVWVPQLTDSGDWYLLHVDPSRGRFPFVWSDRVAPVLEGTNTTDAHEWRIERRAVYTTYARYNVGYGEPRFAVKVA